MTAKWPNVKIEKVEKGKIAELGLRPLTESHRKGLGLPPPGGQSYENRPKRGDLPLLPRQKCLRRSSEGIAGWRIQRCLRQRNPTGQK